MPGQLGGKNFRTLGTHYDKKQIQKTVPAMTSPVFRDPHDCGQGSSPNTNFIQRNCNSTEEEGNCSVKAQLTAHCVLFYFLKKWWSLTHFRPKVTEWKCCNSRCWPPHKYWKLQNQKEWFIDLTDSYFHVPIQPDHKMFLCFAFQGQAYQFEDLSFGFSLWV